MAFRADQGHATRNKDNRPVIRFSQTAALIFALILLSLSPAKAAGAPNPNDTARYLAGLPVADGSPLAKLAGEGAWKRHSATLNNAWKRIEKNQLSKIRAWSEKHVSSNRKLMLYTFSGPDYLYANAFFPNAETYVLSALEPVGPYPNVQRLRRGSRAGALQNLRASMQSVLSYSFFKTKSMKVDLRRANLSGALPVLYVFIARSGNTIEKVQHVSLNPDGTVTQRDGKAPRGSARGAKIVFKGPDGKTRNLYYFSTDLSNAGLKRSGFTKFVSGFGPADSLVKSASYLLHYGNFTSARKYLLENSAVIIQDPSGIPFKHFPRKGWDFKPFGTYRGPIPLFANQYQPQLKRLFSRGRPQKIDWGIGYRWRKHETSVLYAINKDKIAKPEPKKEPEPMKKPEEAMKAPETKPEAMKKPEEAMKAPETKPEAMKKPEEAMKAPETNSEAMKKPDEAMKASDTPMKAPETMTKPAEQKPAQATQ